MERGIARGAGAMGTKGTAPAESGCSSGLGAGMASPAAGSGAASELTGAPHFSQKRASSEISAPQLLHFTAALLPPRASCSPSYLKPHGGRSSAGADGRPSPFSLTFTNRNFSRRKKGRKAEAPHPSWPYIYVRLAYLPVRIWTGVKDVVIWSRISSWMASLMPVIVQPKLTPPLADCVLVHTNVM